MIRAENISVTVNRTKILEDINVEFVPGKINLILGPNGAGKSTLIKVLSGQLKPIAGKIFYGTQEIHSYSQGALAKIRSVLSQNIDVAFPLTASEIVMMGRYPHISGRPGKLDERAAEESMAFFDVLNLADRNYLTLSGGERQRVHFARVLAQIGVSSPGYPRYLLLDEPLTFLDVHYQFQFMHKLVSLVRDSDLIVVGVVHDLNLAARFGDHIVLLNQGRLLAQGTNQEVLSKEFILKAFQQEPVIYRNEDRKTFHVFFE